ncbi:MAG: hypothetical protein AB8H86_01265 [Polyangiales bacterium]
MRADEQVKDSVEESADRDDAGQTAEVPTMTFDDAKKALGEDVNRPGLDEQPTRKIAALSADDAEKVSGERRSVRVFKHPSKPPPPRLELPLATAQFQAIDEELLPDAPAPARTRSRGPITAAALLFAAATGAALAWATHSPTPAGAALASPPSVTQPAEEPPAETPPAAAEETPATEPPASQEPTETSAQANPEQAGSERAESLLEEAEGLRGGERLAALEAAAAADSSNPHAAAALAEFHMENDPHEALEWALQAAQLRRRRASYQDLVADAYERIGNMNDAAHARATAASLREGND